MKTIKEKAKAYDRALKVANKYKDTHIMFPSIKDEMFPELKESEDEKVRKTLIHIVKGACDKYGIKYQGKEIGEEKLLAWLEKQGAQKPAFEMKTPEESLGIDSDTYNKIVDECIYGEQKSTDKVEPKFKVGDKVISILTNNLYYITEVCNGYYLTDVGCVIMFNAQDNFELSNKNPAWSEEDEEHYKACLQYFDEVKPDMVYYKDYQWLKSLKDRVGCEASCTTMWKPSEEQMEALRKAEATIGVNHVVLAGLISDLKKLKG